jgi:hypothetical protein
MTYIPSAAVRHVGTHPPQAAYKQQQLQQHLPRADVPAEDDGEGSEEDTSSRPEPAQQDNTSTVLQEQLPANHALGGHQLPGSTGGGTAGTSSEPDFLNQEQEVKLLSQMGLIDGQAADVSGQQEPEQAVQPGAEEQGSETTSAAVESAHQPGIEYAQVERFR